MVAWDQIVVKRVPLYINVYDRVIKAGLEGMLVSDYVDHMSIITNAILKRQVEKPFFDIQKGTSVPKKRESVVVNETRPKLIRNSRNRK